MFINEEFIQNLSNCNGIRYLFAFSAPNFSMFLTTGDSDIDWLNKHYQCEVLLLNVITNSLFKTNDINVKIPNSYNQQPICVEKVLKARVEIKILLNVDNPSSTDAVSANIFNGFVSQVTKDNGMLNVSISPLTSCLNQSIGDFFSPICRECFGNEKCKLNMDNYKTTGMIQEILSDDCFNGNHQQNKKTSIGYYRYGLIKFISGELKGICAQIKDEIDGKVYLLKSTKLFAVGDEYEIFAGCDKTFTTCKNKFHNAVNFRGEPFIEPIRDDG